MEQSSRGKNATATAVAWDDAVEFVDRQIRFAGSAVIASWYSGNLPKLSFKLVDQSCLQSLAQEPAKDSYAQGCFLR